MENKVNPLPETLVYSNIELPFAVAQYIAPGHCKYENENDDRIRQALLDFPKLIAAVMPELKEGEWMYLCDMLNGHLRGELDKKMEHLIGEVWEARIDSLPKKWEVDLEAFTERLSELPDASVLAIYHVAKTFWSPRMSRVIAGTHKSILEQCGARII